MTRLAIYPGSFDPLTNGHLDIIKRGSRLFDQLVVSVAVNNSGKTAMFSVEERVAFLKDEVAELKLGGAVEVVSFDGLLMHHAEKSGAIAILRGLRAVTDFDYEFQMTGMNGRINRDIETVFLMASEKHQFIASRMVKEVAGLGGDISGFVPERVAKALAAKA